jgi:hypothetical protein
LLGFAPTSEKGPRRCLYGTGPGRKNRSSHFDGFENERKQRSIWADGAHKIAPCLQITQAALIVLEPWLMPGAGQAACRRGFHGDMGPLHMRSLSTDTRYEVWVDPTHTLAPASGGLRPALLQRQGNAQLARYRRLNAKYQLNANLNTHLPSTYHTSTSIWLKRTTTSRYALEKP